MPEVRSAGGDEEFEQLSLDVGLTPPTSDIPELAPDYVLAEHSFNFRLKDLPATERPRDRLLEVGPSP